MKKNSIFLFVLATCFTSLTAQNIDLEHNYVLIREDVVKPSMTADYEGAIADLSLFLKENKVKDVNYLTQLQDNYHYSHVSFIKDLSEVEGGMRAYINRKKNSAEFNLIWDYLNETIESYGFYIVKYKPELSYVPDGKVWLETAPYRKWNYYYFKPGTEAQVEQLMASWASLYKQKGIEHGFRVFKGLIGTENPVYIFTTWAESPLDYQQGLQDNIKLLGEEGGTLWMDMMKYVRDVETIEGWYLPQYSYQPE